MPTLRPPWNLVPRWRTRILPAGTSCPPKRLTPNRLASESRPLRDEPPAFLCAIFLLLPSRSGRLDALDLHLGEILAVRVLASIMLAPLLLEHDQMRPARLLDDRTGDLGAAQRRRAELRPVAGVQRQHRVEGDGR